MTKTPTPPGSAPPISETPKRSSEEGDRKIFVAGSTGAVGRTVLRLASERGLDSKLLAHRRPKSAEREGKIDNTAVFELGDSAALENALAECSSVLQLIGTMRKRFASGDTYESSDIGTTRQLVEAAQKAGVSHLILLSSVGAGRPVGAYLKAKAKAEALVRDSGIAWTIVRPSAFEGEGHPNFPVLRAISSALKLHTFAPIRVEDLAGALFAMADAGAPKNTVVEGKLLWEWVAKGRELLGR